MRNEARKLTIFTTRNMKALLTTEELDPVMARLGFTATVTHSHPPSSVANSAVTAAAESMFIGWREYVFNGKWVRVKSLDQPPPMALLPHPRIDGLHESIYSEFIKAVEFYLRRDDVTEILHIRGLPLDRFLDRGKAWRSMEDAEIVVFVYREVPKMEMNDQLCVDRKKGLERRQRSRRIPAEAFDEDEDDDGDSGAGRLVEFGEIVLR